MLNHCSACVGGLAAPRIAAALTAVPVVDLVGAATTLRMAAVHDDHNSLDQRPDHPRVTRHRPFAGPGFNISLAA
jgi:hypothetical protein